MIERKILSSNPQKPNDWSSNGVEGRGLRRAYKKLLSKLDTTEDVNELATITRSMAYVAQAKSGLKDNEEVKKLKEEVVEIKKTLSMAQNNTIAV